MKSPENRPYVICHMIQTANGIAAPGDPDISLLDEFFYQYTKAEEMLDARAWMIGRVTAESFAENIDTTLESPPYEIDTNDFITENNNTSFVFVLDTHGVLRWRENTLSFSNGEKLPNLVVIVTEQTPLAYLAYLRAKEISYIFGGEQEVDFHKTLKKIKAEFGMEKLLLEGGPTLIRSMWEAGLIDEFSLVVAPRIAVGNGAPHVLGENNGELVYKDYIPHLPHVIDNCIWLRLTRD